MEREPSPLMQEILDQTIVLYDVLIRFIKQIHSFKMTGVVWPVLSLSAFVGALDADIWQGCQIPIENVEGFMRRFKVD